MLEKNEKMIQEITKLVNEVKSNLASEINKSVIYVYWNIGRIIVSNENENNNRLEYGKEVLKGLSYLLTKYLGKGYSLTNLKYMRTLYNEYEDDLEFVQLVAQLPWTHNIIAIEKVKDKIIRKWYMERCTEEGWSKSIFIYQIETNLYRRQVKSIKHNNFNVTLNNNSDLASNIMKDPYVLDIIELSDKYKEKELENKMLTRIKYIIYLIKKFIL